MHSQERLINESASNDRTARLRVEVLLLTRLCGINPEILSVVSQSEVRGEFRVRVQFGATPSPFRNGPNDIVWRTKHEITLLFDRLFPLVPFESYISDPPYHPNISPDDGFICLWEDFRPERTIVDGIAAIRNVLTWQSANFQDEHLMCLEASQATDLLARFPAPEWPRLRLPVGDVPIATDA